jgi:trehalose synthase
VLPNGGAGGNPSFIRQDGSTGRVTRTAEMLGESRPQPGARLVVQISRWDQLKDPMGVLQAFARSIAPRAESDLLLAGPAPSAIQDDPEGPGVLAQVQAAWRQLPPPVRGRIHLAGLPMVDLDENAAMVNALQRRAHIVVQKSIAEGFGLTVAEAMWKARPVVGTRVGGIQDQIEDGRSGILIDHPQDLEAFGAAVVRLLRDQALAERLGAAANERVRREFLAPRQIVQEAQLVMEVIQEGSLA